MPPGRPPDAMPTAPVSAVRGGWLLWTERAIVYGLVYATSITALKLPDLAMNVHITDSLVWKFSRFTRKREHAVAFKSMLRRKGIRVVSITEHADDSPTGKLMEAIIESMDEFYSENLAEEVYRGMREAASRGFWVASRVPYGYRKLMVQDGAKKRPTLEPDPDTSPVVKRIFCLAESGKGILDITRTLNGEGIANPTGRLWSKNGVHIILRNEAYTGTLIPVFQLTPNLPLGLPA